MSDNEENGGVEVSTQGRYPTVNEQMNIINDALDACLEKTTNGRWRYGKLTVSSAYVMCEATYTLMQGSTYIDGYVGKHPVVWFLDGALTPANVRNHIHAALDSKGF